MRFLLVLLIVLGVIGAGAVEWANAAWDAAGPGGAGGSQTRGPDRAAHPRP